MPIILSSNQSPANAAQGSPEWLQARCGKITASRIKDVMSKTKKRADYLMELVAERLSGDTGEHYTSPAMKWGTDNEPAAREAYAVALKLEVRQVGFIVHPHLQFAGASPDGLVGHVGGLEIKCPNTTTHLRWMLADEVPEEHADQMQWNIECTGRSWWDFMSYDPRLPVGTRAFLVRLPRDQGRIDKIVSEIIKFNVEIEAIIKKLGR